MKFTSNEREIITKKTEELCKLIQDKVSTCDYEIDFRIGCILINCNTKSIDISSKGKSYQYRAGGLAHRLDEDIYDILYEMLRDIVDKGGIDIVIEAIDKEITKREFIHNKILDIDDLKIDAENSEEKGTEEKEKTEEIKEEPENKSIARNVLNDIKENVCSLTVHTQVDPNAIGEITISDEFDAIVMIEKVRNFIDSSKNHIHKVKYDLKKNEISYYIDDKYGDFDAMFQATNVSQKYKVIISDVAEYIMRNYFEDRATIFTESTGLSVKFKPFKNSHIE